MNPLLPHVREQSEVLAAAAERRPAAAVPPCPGWTVADVARHVGRVHRLFAAAVRSGDTARPDLDVIEPVVDELPAWVRAGAEELLAALAGADPDRPVWNWTGTPAPPAWVERRMIHETAVHRWDAEVAVAGAGASPVPAEIAPDGIEEFFELILARRTEPWAGPAVTVALARTDGPERWTVRAVEGGGVESVPAAGGEPAVDVAARGSASDLLLALWRRVPASELEVEGDAEALARFLAWPRL